MSIRIDRSARRLAVFVTLLLTCTAPLFAQRAIEPISRPAIVERVAAIGMTVSDLDRSVAFFADVLTFERVAEEKRGGDAFAVLAGLPSTTTARVARLRLGDEVIELTEFESPKGRAFPADTHSNDRWFQHIAIIVSDMDRAHARLRRNNVVAASKGGPQRLPDWNKNAAGIKAFYFRDPDGHYLEILEFPAGKGDPKWHAKAGSAPTPRDRDASPRLSDEGLFLGIDHTAIVVGDTEASLRFYRDTLGLKVVGQSENHGPEQEALNNVAGARLRITTLRAESGPAIEFLEYLNPRDGRRYPADARSNDMLHWQVTLISRNSAALAETLRAQAHVFVSIGQFQIDTSRTSHQTGFVVRDPDGHAMEIRSP